MGSFDLLEHGPDIHAAMFRRERREAPRRFLELTLTPWAVAAPRLVPRDRDVNQPLEEVTLLGSCGSPHELELFVGGEEVSVSDQIEAASEMRPLIDHWTRH